MLKSLQKLMYKQEDFKMKQHKIRKRKIKGRLLSMLTALTMLTACFTAMPITANAAITRVTQKSLLSGYDYNALKAGGKVSGSEAYTYNKNIADVVQNYSKAYSEQITDTMFLLDVQQVKNVRDNGSALGDSDYYKPNLNYYWLRTPYSGSDTAVRYVFSSNSVNKIDWSKGL